MHFPSTMKPFPMNGSGSRLPTYEEATCVVDTGRLPSYKKTRRSRHKPYGRLLPVDEDDIARLFNTVYDEERIELVIPAAPVVARPVPDLVPRPLIDRRRATEVAMAILNGFILLGPRPITCINFNSFNGY